MHPLIESRHVLTASPYGSPISLERADGLIAAAVAEAREHEWKLNVAVVDSGGTGSQDEVICKMAASMLK